MSRTPTPRTLADWQARAAELSFESRAFIDNSFVAAESGATFESRNPATGEILAQVASCDEPDAARAVAVARRAFADGAWSRLAPGKRKKTLLRLADLMEAHKHELALIDTLGAASVGHWSELAGVATNRTFLAGLTAIGVGVLGYFRLRRIGAAGASLVARHESRLLLLTLGVVMMPWLCTFGIARMFRVEAWLARSE